MQFSAAEMQAAKRDPKQFTLAEDSVRIETRGEAMTSMALPKPPSRDFNPDPLVVVDQIINTSLKIWKVVDDNKPVVDVKTQYASAVPEGITNWAQLSGWYPPKGSPIYGFSVKNFYGVTVVDISYQVVRTAGGSYKGKGRYLTGVTIEPLMVSVAWGYHVTLSAEVTSVTNADTTGANPLAGMMLNAKWRIQTSVKDMQGQGVYYVQGDGFFKEVGGPFQTKQIANVRSRVEGLSSSLLDSTGGGTANAPTQMETLSKPVNCHAYPAAPGCPDFCHHHHGFPGCNPRMVALDNCASNPLEPGCPGYCANEGSQMYPGCPMYCSAYPSAPECQD
ncbi:MAG: hypothetical protein NT031_13215 [Planctomycetota bacterium]|nr:hypothetical protein [Planctomycetota bacterium]